MDQLAPYTENGYATLWNNGDPWGSPDLDKNVDIPGTVVPASPGPYEGEVPGQPVHVVGGLLAGPTSALMQWVGEQWNARVEPVYLADGFDYRAKRGNSTDASEHAAGTACDFNAPDHPFQSGWAGFSDAQVATLRQIATETDEGQGPLINLGGEWGDGMHVERAQGATDDRITAFLSKVGMPGPPLNPPTPQPEDDMPYTPQQLQDVVLDALESPRGKQALVNAIGLGEGIAASTVNPQTTHLDADYGARVEANEVAHGEDVPITTGALTAAAEAARAANAS